MTCFPTASAVPLAGEEKGDRRHREVCLTHFQIDILKGMYTWNTTTNILFFFLLSFPFCLFPKPKQKSPPTLPNINLGVFSSRTKIHRTLLQIPGLK